jgi:hypothetical protein
MTIRPKAHMLSRLFSPGHYIQKALKYTVLERIYVKNFIPIYIIRRPSCQIVTLEASYIVYNYY